MNEEQLTLKFEAVFRPDDDKTIVISLEGPSSGYDMTEGTTLSEEILNFLQTAKRKILIEVEDGGTAILGLPFPAGQHGSPQSQPELLIFLTPQILDRSIGKPEDNEC